MLRAAVLALAALASPLALRAQDTLRISGTGSGTGGMAVLAQAFMAANAGIRVEVLPAIGSAGGINALIAGKLDLALSNREPSTSELARVPMRWQHYASTPFVVAVHSNLGIREASTAQLAAWYAPGATFPNGLRARPVLRRSDATDTRLLRSMSPEVAKAYDEASARAGMLDAGTDADAADLLQSTPGTFGVSTLALIMSERRLLVALVIDGRAPSLDNIASGQYPWHKKLYAVTRESPGRPALERFLAFVRSPAGAALLRANGHLPA